MKGMRRFLCALVAPLLLAGPFAAVRAAAGQGGAEPALTGERYQVMRSLAQYLDETAQGLLEGASDTVLFGTPSDARYLSPIRAFARSARDFRSALDGYERAPFDVAPRVAALAEVSQAVDERLRAANVLPRTYPEWAAVREALERMRLSLSGADVNVPAEFVVPELSGARLERFRELAAALDESATRTHGRARQEMGSYQERGRQFLGELHYFAALSRDLHTRADAGAVNPKGIGPVVDDLLEEARDADRRMRDAAVFKEVWTDSSRTITILQEMASLVRS